ncbi:MAG TPA: ParA family protein [Pseudonocardia sp.]|uniref:ParA family protein n=1 Tax=Pseudonocardia sp. TaxID=60912 RepID=UPI002F405622
MQVVAVLSLKGGVGKTTVVLGLAGAAMQRQLRTLVVDLDPQANATVALRPDTTDLTIADVLDEPLNSTLGRAIGASAWSEDLDVLVGSESNERHNHPEPSTKQLSRLNRALGHLEAPEYSDDPDADDEYDLVIIDCPPSLGQLTRSALVAADRAVLVTDPTIFAVAGVQRAFEAVQSERVHNNPHLQPLGVMVNRVRARSSEHAFRISELRELFGPLVLTGFLPDRSAIQQAQGACVPIQHWDTPGAREASAIFDLLLGRLMRSAGRAATEDHLNTLGRPTFTANERAHG